VIALLALMLLYIVFGLPGIRVENLAPFAPNGTASIFFTTGFVFVSYAGLLKIASVAEEIRDPSRNIPLGMIVSLLVVSVFYSLMLLVTAGVLEPAALSRSLTPISDGAEAFLGGFGKIALSIAAIFAFLSTANAGIMTAARSLVPLSRDGLLPQFFSKINKRFGTPHNALVVTGLVISAALLLKLDILIARCREGIFFSEKEPSVHAVFVIMGSKDERNSHLYSLAAVAQIVRDPQFEKRWAGAKTKEALRDIVLLGERRRQPTVQSSPPFV